jgi:hypothetical protein
LSNICKAIGCVGRPPINQDFCEPCRNKELEGFEVRDSLVDRYPSTYKALGDVSEIDHYAVLHLFQIQDPSGCLQDASKKLLMSGSSSTRYRDIREAKDILVRWLQLNQELSIQ